jgi:hypothetical protein
MSPWGAEIGLPIVEDFNGTEREGIGLLQANINDGTRHSVLDGYLLPRLGAEISPSAPRLW